MTNEECVFCKIVQDNSLAQIVYKDDYTLAFMALRQYHPGHTLIIPIRHFNDIRELDPATGAALMATLSKLTRSVSICFPNDGISIWHSIGPAAFQEVPHLHIHIHPRLPGDDFLKIYPGGAPESTDAALLKEYAVKLKQTLNKGLIEERSSDK